MEHDLERLGMNESDQWRSHWIDCLVRERILQRELVPHRHNPEDLVPVIKLRDDYQVEAPAVPEERAPEEEAVQNWDGLSLDELRRIEPATADMAVRIIISVEQFTSFRSFAWCPLGSLHRRLRPFDPGMSFQRAVEYLIENDIADLSEYPNPQSSYQTKGISLNADHEVARQVLQRRDDFIRLLLRLYEKNTLISEQHLRQEDPQGNWEYDLWFSIMETENVLNALPGRLGQYSLFRTHHTVKLVAGDETREGKE
jgi:hypothetical protein